jgi:outer membrane protein OmpA-like peptidoglycan-associated protein
MSIGEKHTTGRGRSVAPNQLTIAIEAAASSVADNLMAPRLHKALMSRARGFRQLALNTRIPYQPSKSSMKNILSITACALSVSLLSACASGPDRDKEVALNQQVGIDVTQTREGVQVRLPDRVLFDFDQSSLRADSAPVIKRAVVLLRRSKMSVIVQGHTDNIGTHEYNQSLSEARAKTVANALVLRDIAASRVTTEGFAYDKPAASNDTPEGQAKNRRTEIVVIGESLDAIMGKEKR